MQSYALNFLDISVVCINALFSRVHIAYKKANDDPTKQILQMAWKSKASMPHCNFIEPQARRNIPIHFPCLGAVNMVLYHRVHVCSCSCLPWKLIPCTQLYLTTYIGMEWKEEDNVGKFNLRLNRRTFAQLFHR